MPISLKREGQLSDTTNGIRSEAILHLGAPRVGCLDRLPCGSWRSIS